MKSVRLALAKRFGASDRSSPAILERSGSYLNNCSEVGEPDVIENSFYVEDDLLQQENTFDNRFGQLDFYRRPTTPSADSSQLRRTASWAPPPPTVSSSSAEQWTMESANRVTFSAGRLPDPRPQQSTIVNSHGRERSSGYAAPPPVMTDDARSFADDDPLLQDLHGSRFEPIDNNGHDNARNPLEPKHCHTDCPKRDFSAVRVARNKLIVISIVCCLFMVGEAVGGYFASSLAVMTDAAHLLSDLASFVISLFALWVGKKKPSPSMSFGYFRAEILGAVVSVLMIWLLTGILVYLAIERVIHRDFEIEADIMMIVSGCGIVVNIVMAVILNGFGGGHGHSHGGLSTTSEPIEDGSHQHSHGNKNINVRAAFIHIIGDLVQSIGVFISALIIKFKPDFILADPICTFVFSIIVLITTFAIMRDAVYILMEGFPKHLKYKELKIALESIEGVQMAHDMHAWSLTMDKTAFTVHLAVNSDVDNHIVLEKAEALLQQKYKMYSVTIQIERYQHSVMAACDNCKILADT